MTATRAAESLAAAELHHKTTIGQLVRALGAIAIAGLVASCTVGPEYPPPLPPLAASAAGFVAASPAHTTDRAPDAWWRLYHDPALDTLIAQALAANTDLRIASANLAEARAVLDQTRAGFLPQTTIAGGTSYGVSTAELAAAGEAGRPPRSNWSLEAGLDVSWEIDLFGRRRHAVEAARADADSIAAASDGLRVVVAAETARAYADACAYAAASAIQRNSIATADRGVALTEAQRAAGAVGDFEVTRAQALAEQTRAGLPLLEAQRDGALYRLAVLTGRPPETRIAAAESCWRAPILAQPLPVGDGRALLARRPDIRQAERALAAATARIGVATADLYPTISLGGSVASLASSIAGLGSLANRSWSIGPLLAWSVPNMAAARARIRGADAAAQAALARFDGTVLAALSDAEQALAREAAELARRAALTRTRDRDAAALAIAESRYRAGAISFLDLLDSQRTLIGDDNALALSAEALATDQVLVFKALGGGWRQASAG